MKTNRILSTLLLCVLSLGLGGCYNPDSHGDVYRQWSRRMAEMGIFPVYPPREDVVVGDVYAIPLHPYDSAAVGYIGGLGNAGVHVSYLGDTNLGWTNFMNKLEKYYQTRPYPADSTNNLLAGTNLALTRVSGYPDATVRDSAFGPGSKARLRQVSFPDFNISHVDQQSLSAVIPIEGLMAGLNFNRSDITGVYFRIPHAESYGMTTEEVLDEIYKDGAFTNYDGKIYMKGDTKDSVISVPGAQMAYAMFRDVMKNVGRLQNNTIPPLIRLHLGRSRDVMEDKIYMALISEVYFARSIDITLERKTATGASGSARPISSSELQKLKDMGLLATRPKTNSTTTTQTNITATSTNVFEGTEAQVIDVTEGDTAYDLARKLRDIKTPDGVENVGGSVKVLSVSTSSIGLRRTFERPICVGVRGVLIKIDVNHPFVFASDTNSPPIPWMRVESFGSPATVLTNLMTKSRP